MSDDTSSAMTSHRPYLLRALYEWIADNGMTPHILVDATHAGVRVPAHTVKDGKVVLNIANRAVSKLELDNESVRFSARFGGVSQGVLVPVGAVLAIYARETGQGMALPEEIAGSEEAHAPADSAAADPDGPHDDDQTPSPSSPPSPRRGSHLRVVK